MDVFFNQLDLAPIHDQTVRALLEAALAQFYAFTLVLIRLAGLMVVGPVFGQSVVPANMRVLLILAMALLITPALGAQQRALFHKLDADQNGVVTREEVPDFFESRYEALRQLSGKPAPPGLTVDDFRVTVRPARAILDYAWISVGEFSLGFALGLGVLTILSGLQLAGELVDQQTGLSLGEIANPGLNITGSVTGQFLFMFAMTVLLVAPPSGYHLTMVSALVETFQSIPPGEAFITVSAVELLRDLVHQSLVLAVQIAAPLLATMSLVALTMGFLSHSIPQINVLVVGFPVRVLVSLAVLIASLSGTARAVVDVVPTVIDGLQRALTG